MNKTNLNNLNRFNLGKYKSKLHKSIVTLRDMHINLVKADMDTVELITGLTSFYNFALRLFENKGPVYALAYLKESRHYFLVHLSGNKPKRNRELWVAKTKEGLPRNLGSRLIKLCRNKDEYALKNILTALFLTRNLPLHASSADYSTITGGKEVLISNDLKKFSYRYVKHRNWKVSRTAFDTHLSTSMGPNGPAMMASYEDLCALSCKQRDSIKEISHSNLLLESYFRDDVPI